MRNNIKELLRQVFEVLAPNLDHYRKPLRKGRVVETYPADGKYYCDIELLLNSEEPDTNEPIVRMVEIPVIWAGAGRGIICPPMVGTYCDVDYYHGDPDYPRISNFRWLENSTPNCATDELIIQQKNGVHIHIKANSDIEIKTPAAVMVDAASKVEIKSGTMQVNISGDAVVKAAKVQVDAPVINLGENASCKAVHDKSPCPLFGVFHLTPSETVKVAL